MAAWARFYVRPCMKQTITKKGGTTLMRSIRLEDMVGFPRPGYRLPGEVRFSSDNRTLYYLYAEEGTARTLWAYDLASGQRRQIAAVPEDGRPVVQTFDEEMRQQRARRRWTGISTYEVQGSLILVLYGGRVYVGEEGAALAPVEGLKDAVDPHWSPDGQKIFLVMEDNLWVVDRQSGSRWRLTDGGGSGLSYGVAEYAAQEELGRSRGYWLSPEAGWVALTEVNERHIPPYPITHLEGETVWVEEHRYPFVGRDNARVRLGIRSVDPARSDIAWLDWGDGDPYLLDVLWLSEEEIAVQTLSRDHQRLAWDVYGVGGALKKHWYQEQSQRWINRPPTSYVLPDGRLISTSERAGLRRVLVLSPDGEFTLWPEPLREGPILDVIPTRDPSHIWVRAARHRSLERSLWRLDLDGGAVRDCFPEPGLHQALVSDDGQWWIDTWSNITKPPQVEVYLGSVKRGSLVSAHPIDASLPAPQCFEVTASDGTVLNGLVYLPEGDAPPGGWPVIDAVYGGPAAQMVVNDWSETVDFQAQYLAQHGFVVMKVDNRGSANRGPDFEGALFRRFGEVELADQVAGLGALAQRWPVDLSRVGIYGWSYGGYMTLRALMMAPETFKVGVAGAPVTDFRWYDTAYTERYLSTDHANPEGYASTSLINKAARLRGKLLLIHGMVDENVHFHHSAALIEAFIQADRDFELIVLPGSRHMVTDAQVERYRIRRTVEFFERHL